MTYHFTTVDWGNFVKDLFMEYYVIDIAPDKFTGILEIDESLIGRKVKYKRGTCWKVCMDFGLYERISGRLKLFQVNKRNANTL